MDCNIALLIKTKLIYDDLATSCKHLVNFGPVNPEFKRVKRSATFALLLDLVGISTEFCWGYHYLG